MSTQVRDQSRFRLGLMFAIGSAFTFSTSGPLAKSLMEAGWSATAAVTARMACGALLMVIVASVIRPGWVREARQHARVLVLYGFIPVAGAQLCYFNAVAHLSVGVALLLEYTAPILVVGWLWATTQRRPSGMTLAGVALAIAGITLVLNIFSGGASAATPAVGAHGTVAGVAWAVGAALCAACYFMMSGQVSSSGAADDQGLHSITLATGGLITGALAVALLGFSGVMPMQFTANDVVVAGTTLPWLVPVIVLGVIPTAVAYWLGIAGVSRLRPGFASLVGLSEVLFAVLAAWVLLGEAVSATQAIGGVVVLLGLALARHGDDDRQPDSNQATDSQLASHL